MANPQTTVRKKINAMILYRIWIVALAAPHGYDFRKLRIYNSRRWRCRSRFGWPYGSQAFVCECGVDANGKMSRADPIDLLPTNEAQDAWLTAATT